MGHDYSFEENTKKTPFGLRYRSPKRAFDTSGRTGVVVGTRYENSINSLEVRRGFEFQN
jgi:hypothetical protein